MNSFNKTTVSLFHQYFPFTDITAALQRNSIVGLQKDSYAQGKPPSNADFKMEKHSPHSDPISKSRSTAEFTISFAIPGKCANQTINCRRFLYHEVGEKEKTVAKDYSLPMPILCSESPFAMTKEPRVRTFIENEQSTNIYTEVSQLKISFELFTSTILSRTEPAHSCVAVN
jgi:hypothetical protein